MKHQTEIHFRNTEQALVELIGDFLDDRRDEEMIHEVSDPQPRSKTDLHIRMAKAAFEVYKQTVKEI